MFLLAAFDLPHDGDVYSGVGLFCVHAVLRLSTLDMITKKSKIEERLRVCGRELEMRRDLLICCSTRRRCWLRGGLRGRLRGGGRSSSSGRGRLGTGYL